MHCSSLPQIVKVTASVILKTLLVTPLMLPAFFLFVLLMPISFPAWLALEFFYAARFGSGLRPVFNPVQTAIIARIISWLTCSAVAAFYLSILQWFHWEYGPILPLARLPALALVLGFAAVQAPFIWMECWQRLMPGSQDHLAVSDHVTYQLTRTSPGEDFQIYTITRRSAGRLSTAASFMCPCETPNQSLKIVDGDSDSVDLEGVFSTRAFHFPAMSAVYKDDYEMGIVKVTFHGQSIPKMNPVTWLSNAHRQVKAN